jgi:outer membrane lipoprotein-sorting protein
MRRPTITRRARWAVPAGALAVVGAVAAGAIVAANAQASPVLPVRTPAQLLAAVAGESESVPPFTGSVVENANLGLPDLPGMDDLGSLMSLLTGSHTVNIWYSSPRHLRVSVPSTMSESDLFVDGNSAWSWDSTSNDVTHYLLPAHAKQVLPKMPVLTPQQAAQQALAAVGPTTRVSLQSNVTVAGQGAYQLVLKPKSTQSLVGEVSIAVDADHDIPLRVQVFARRATSPVFQVGFTSIAFVQPAASDLTFSPPPRASVTTVKLNGENRPHYNKADAPLQLGQSWLTVFRLPSSDLSGDLLGLSGSQVPVGVSGRHVQGLTGRTGQVGAFGSSSQAAAQQAVGNAASSTAQSVAGSPAGGGSGGINVAGLLGLVMREATPVHGSWGSGELLRTSLLSVLVTKSGEVYLGAVTPAVLYHDAAQGK